MTTRDLLLALDQGTTSCRAIVYTAQGAPVAAGQYELPQIFPQPGWVEHDGEAIWNLTLRAARDALAKTPGTMERIAALGITNQRETILLWERDTGRLLHNAIVWQDRRTSHECQRLRDEGHLPLVRDKTGLLLDPYFSATKLAWLLDAIPDARLRAERGELAAGTVDCFLLWRLTGGRVHATDASNAARTALFNIHSQAWDADLLRLFRVPVTLLPRIVDCSGEIGETEPHLFGRALPICGMAGDQQAATFGQAAFDPGMIKSTYGTGCFMLANTGSQPVRSTHNLLTTIAWRIQGQTTYALEGSIFMAGATIQWLRDGLKIIKHAAETEALARGIKNNGGVYLVPSFVGLGAPWWDAEARGAIFGLSRDSGPAQIARAALESIAYQTRDLTEAMHKDGLPTPKALRVDGGLTANGWAMQFLADLLGLPVERPTVTETTSLGAAYLAGLAAGIYPSLDAIRTQWRRDAAFVPAMPEDDRTRLYGAWLDAVQRVRTS